MTSRYRIITVCTGNICRSPMAELMLRQALQGTFAEVDSAGTTDWERGNPIDPRAVKVLKKHGVEIGDGHRARKFSPEDFNNDLILALDTDHFDWLKQHAPSEARPKIHLLREFDARALPEELGIADPWYGGAEDFEETFELIQAALPGILEQANTPVPGNV
ncbi:protein-tyrosine phosphatase [Psychromicrobium silvestre]|uniref:protein-tyrosine-phosphatase n=1 Tax=Psychromicrobium silvestre TaxID=1645614 RepID=A0A7Y9LU58_9MICC|nr:low molecular weight protein-tyrosine-phosphatase [Psychromicrobium silvestre]NYE95679.1 protein-tyrosine phosphatase [Psychromicrobium silvestre]